MERKLASIQTVLEVNPIEGADKIEVATILGWKVVVNKGDFQPGDDCVYFEVDSLLPLDVPIWSFLGKGSSSKKTIVDGKVYEGYRLKTIRLRGQISQGLALPLHVVNPHSSQALSQFDIGTDVTEYLRVVKYEPPIPSNLSGKIKGMRPTFVPKTDEMRIQAVPQILERWKEYRFVVTEKLDGSSISIYYNDGDFGVCSRNLDLLKDVNNTQWSTVLSLDLESKLNKLSRNIVLQGEIVGEGIQGNPLKIKGHKIYFYNVYDPEEGRYFNHQEFVDAIEELGLETVPVITSNLNLPTTVELLVDYASKVKSLANVEVIPEGFVFRPWIEQKDKDLGRLSFKVINPEYLLTSDN